MSWDLAGANLGQIVSANWCLIRNLREIWAESYNSCPCTDEFSVAVWLFFNGNFWRCSSGCGRWRTEGVFFAEHCSSPLEMILFPKAMKLYLGNSTSKFKFVSLGKSHIPFFGSLFENQSPQLWHFFFLTAKLIHVLIWSSIQI